MNTFGIGFIDRFETSAGIAGKCIHQIAVHDNIESGIGSDTFDFDLLPDGLGEIGPGNPHSAEPCRRIAFENPALADLRRVFGDSGF